MQLCLGFLLLSLAVCGVLAYPNPSWTADDASNFFDGNQAHYLEEQLPEEEAPLHRLRRQLNVQGGGSPRQGFDLSVNGRAPVWQSHNGRHSLDATGQYSQHLGGPYGNSRPNWGAGAQYTFRF